jgi:DNA-binding CsgD family transcriptional regulator
VPRTLGAALRVAGLAAQGLTTAQIAKSLYLSPKTVDWHLGHVYQKLGVGSRRQLATALADRVLKPV